MPDEMTPPAGEPIAVLRASPGRRVLATGCMAVLGVLLISVALFEPPAVGWQILLIWMAAACAFLATKVWAASALAVELHEDGVYDSSGRLLARLDEITEVERGTFSFRPSGGFVLKLKDPATRGWAPGLWWRTGRRVGIGGTIPAAPARLMADTITLVLAERA